MLTLCTFSTWERSRDDWADPGSCVRGSQLSALHIESPYVYGILARVQTCVEWGTL